MSPGARGLLRGLALLAAVGSTQGCFATRSDVRLLQDEIRALRATVASADTARQRETDVLRSDARRTDDTLRAIGTRIGRLQADMNDRFRDVDRQLITVQELTGQSQRRLQELRAALEERPAEPPAIPPGAVDTSAVPVGPALPGPLRLFEIGRGQLDGGSPSSARETLDTLIGRYPTADVVPTAQFFVAEAYAMEGNRAAADSVYALVIARHPRADRAPSALYKLAMSYRAAGRATAARPLLERLVRDFPRSDEAGLARDLLRAR